MKALGVPWTIRTRLTLLYAGAFLVAGVILVVVVYLTVGHVLGRQLAIPLDGVAPGSDVPPMPPMAGEAGGVATLLRRVRLDTLDAMLLASLAMVGVLTAAAGAVGWLLAGQALRPLRDISATARRVADRSLHERIALRGPDDEVKELADTLDAMLERLDRAFDGQGRLIANASHELRTPLTIARTLIEVALLDPTADERLRQLATTLLVVNRRHERLTNDLLTLASSERLADFHTVDLGEVAGGVVAELRPLAEAAGLAVESDLRAGAVLGDAGQLERLVRNLVENAIQYNQPEDGWLRVANAVVGHGIELVVENVGPAVPAAEVPGLFEPFRRLAATERLAGGTGGPVGRGAGLGLSIVRAVAEAHGGEVRASPRKGGGLVVRVRIPAAP